jgi:tetratricopeptide (TPR) repeat protein
MNDDIARQQAMVLFERAYRKQVKGELGDAIDLYKRSLAMYPTAEAFTFLGWTYSILNRYDEAIECCKQAIKVDPHYGNPYNDIGAYLIEMEEWEKAIPWLEQAATAKRYDAPQFPQLNLGRAYEHLGRFRSALGCFDKALELDPFYRPAIWAKFQLLGRMN